MKVQPHCHDLNNPRDEPWYLCHRKKQRFERIIRDAQNSICKAVEEIDGKKFHEDAWTRPGGGGGISRVLQVRAYRCAHVARLHLRSRFL